MEETRVGVGSLDSYRDRRKKGTGKEKQNKAKNEKEAVFCKQKKLLSDFFYINSPRLQFYFFSSY